MHSGVSVRIPEDRALSEIEERGSAMKRCMAVLLKWLWRFGAWTVPACLTGVLLWAAFPPHGLWFLAWVALVPLVARISYSNKRSAFFQGWLAGSLFHYLANYLTVRAHMGAITLSPLQGLWWGVFGLLTVIMLKRRCPLWLSCGVALSIVEFLKSVGPFACCWLPLGSSQAVRPALIQGCAWFGTIGLSGLIAAFNGAVVDLGWIVLDKRFRWGDQGGVRVGRPSAVGSLWASRGSCAVMGFAILNALVGHAILHQSSKYHINADTLRVAIIQSNLEGEMRWSGNNFRNIVKLHMDLTRESLSSDPELIVWPESALGLVPNSTWSMVPGIVRRLAMNVGRPILLGIVNEDGVTGESHNSATIVTPHGRLSGRYDKIRLLPFAEWVPRGFSFMAGPRIRGSGHRPAARQIVLPLFPSLSGRDETVGVGVFICFEALFPETVRRLPGLGAHVLVHLSDEYWYRDPHLSKQSFSLDVMRAVENRRSLIRAANAGPSGVIDPWGRPISVFRAENGETCFETGWVACEVPLKKGQTLYSRFAPLIALLPWGVLAGVIIRHRRWKKARGAFS